MSDFECRISNVGCQISDVSCRMSNLGCQMSDVSVRMSNLGCQLSDVGCRIVGSRMSDNTYKLPYFIVNAR